MLRLRPHETPFEDGTFKLTMEFTEEYPNKPPTVRFVSKMFHPNGKLFTDLFLLGTDLPVLTYVPVLTCLPVLNYITGIHLFTGIDVFTGTVLTYVPIPTYILVFTYL